MSKKEEALKLALEALAEWKQAFPDNWDAFDEQAITAIREALAEESSGTEQPGNHYDDVRESMRQAFEQPAQQPLTDTELINQGCRYQTELTQPAQQKESEAVRSAWMAGYTEGEREALEKQPTQQDLPDLISGALGVSRGTAYDMMREALAGAREPEQQRWAAYSEDDERVTCYDSQGEACSEQECEIDNDFEPGDVVEYLVAPMLSAKQVLRTRDAYWLGDRIVEEANNDLADEMGAEDSPLSIDKEGAEALGKLVMDFLCAHGKTQWWMVDHKREEKRTYVAGSNDEAAQSKGDA